jgi:hypothetical protein
MHPHNAVAVTELGTFAASPCVILGIKKGATALLAHVHRANNLEMTMTQVQEILADAVPTASVALAFISTETYSGSRHGEAHRQEVIITEIEARLSRMGVALVEKNRSKSAAIVTYVGYRLMDDQEFPVEREEMLEFGKWAAAYDKCFGTRTASLPMAIRVGINGETPEAAMIRLYPGMA